MLVDVTFRDGGHQINFEWPEDYVEKHLQLIDAPRSPVNYVELGYWRQFGKFTGKFYSLDFPDLPDLKAQPFGAKRAVMSDFHYCESSLENFPSKSDGVDLLRMTARKEDVGSALELLSLLKHEKNLEVSINLFNITNYTHGEVLQALSQIEPGQVDYVYFADTHGALNLRAEHERFSDYASLILQKGSIPGFHLHDHGGYAMSNYLDLHSAGFLAFDASLNGLGKGLGNLRLEHVVELEFAVELLELYNSFRSLLSMPETPFGLIGSRFSVTDHYALQAESIGISLAAFSAFCESLSDVEKDNFNPKLLPLTSL